MKQLLQNLRSGEMELAEVPSPAPTRGQVLIRTRRSLISAGTERTLVEFGQASLLQKARSQPDKVRQVLDKMRTDGVLPTLEAVFRKLDEPLPLGYCNVGVVMGGPQVGGRWPQRATEDTEQRVSGSSCDSRSSAAAGQHPPQEGIEETRERGPGGSCDSSLSPAPPSPWPAGTRVVSNGPHAEVVCVPRNLCARVPDNVSDEQAAFTVLGAVALQGVRLAQPTLGERFMVVGMGLLGLMTVQILRANGCSVLAVDINPARLALAAQFGARTVDSAAGGDPVAAAQAWTGGAGVDGVLITASARDEAILHQAAEACRQRGRIVLVGVVPLNLRRDDFYKKEFTFQVSCSYGPGRYDEKYEQGGHDYPIGFVRWTEQRNFEAVLEMMATGRLDVAPLITHRFALKDALEAYEVIRRDPSALGVILEYPETVDTSRYVRMPAQGLHGRGTTGPQEHGSPAGGAGGRPARRSGFRSAHSSLAREGVPAVGVIGAGNYARATLLPALAKASARIACVADLNPVAARDAARKFGAGAATTDYTQILADPEIRVVFILVGHHLHARFVCEALEAGKHVFVEKPLCLNEEELTKIERGLRESQGPAGLGEEGSGATASEQGSQSTGPESSASCSSPGAASAGSSSLQISGFGPGPDRSAAAPILMVGFNRRFSPHTVRMKELLRARTGPLCMAMTVNAGAIPPDHWVQDPVRGGGRVIGEGCHFIDLLMHLAGSTIVSVSAAMVGEGAVTPDDKTSITLRFAEGSVGTVHYFANGARSYPKEQLEVFSDGRVLRLENFRRTIGYGFKGFRSFRTWRQDKGHEPEVAHFLACTARGGPPPIPFEELAAVTRASFAAVISARENRVVML